jgi:hypothetical protein
VPDSAPGFRPGTVADADGLAQQVADGLVLIEYRHALREQR